MIRPAPSLRSPTAGAPTDAAPGSPSAAPSAAPSAERPVRHDASAAAGALALPSLAVVDARGADVVTFLQGQLSNDLVGAGAGRGCLAGYCNPKGRLLALPLVLALADGGLRLIVARDLLDGLLQRLRMYVMRADVAFVVRDDLVCLGLTVAPGADGEPLAHGVEALPTTPPGEVLDVAGGADGADSAQICRWHDAPGASSAGTSGEPSAARRYLIVAREETLGARLPDGESAWRLGDIAAGVPRIVAATREAFVPQMVNLQLVGGLSFKKGCYPGQEIVARMQYLGKLKRHMRRFRVAGGATPAIGAGSALSSGDGADGGIVVDAVATPDGTELLAVVRIGADTPQAEGLTLEPLPLPYALGDEAAAGTAGSGARSADT